MNFSDISPFARYVRYLKLQNNSAFPEFIPVDSRIFYAVNGVGLIKVGDVTYTVDEGSLIYIAAGTHYTLLASEVTYLAVNFDFTAEYATRESPITPINAGTFDNREIHFPPAFDEVTCFNNCAFFDNCLPLSEMLTKLEKEYMRKLPFYRRETSAMLTLVLTELARMSKNRTAKDSNLNIKSVAIYIQKHFNEPLDNKSLAEKMHYHPNYLSAEFKRCIGTPIHRYLLETRILKASAFIESGYDNLNEVAVMCGFSDVNYFIRYFKKIMGVSPAKFAKTAKK